MNDFAASEKDLAVLLPKFVSRIISQMRSRFIRCVDKLREDVLFRGLGGTRSRHGSLVRLVVPRTRRTIVQWRFPCRNKWCMSLFAAVGFGFLPVAWMKPIHQSFSSTLATVLTVRRTVSKFVQALERRGLKSLKERPIQLGEPGSPDCFAIG